MIELVFTACLLSGDSVCTERKLTYVENISPMMCMMHAQPELAKWNEGFPKWQVKRWSCKMVDFTVVDL